MRTQASPNLCLGFKWLIAFDFNLDSLQLCHAARRSPSVSNPSIPTSSLITRASVFNNAMFGRRFEPGKSPANRGLTVKHWRCAKQEDVNGANDTSRVREGWLDQYRER